MGTYYHASSGGCLPCEAGSYQDEEGQLECRRCPQQDQQYDVTGARHITECGGKIIRLVWFGSIYDHTISKTNIITHKETTHSNISQGLF